LGTALKVGTLSHVADVGMNEAPHRPRCDKYTPVLLLLGKPESNAVLSSACQRLRGDSQLERSLQHLPFDSVYGDFSLN